MKPIRVLLWLLVAGAVVVSVYTFSRAESREGAALATVQQEAALERDRVAALKQATARMEELEAARAALAGRLIGDNPFAEMERALDEAAAQAQVRLEVISLSGAVGVEGMTGLGQYGAEVEVTGTFPQFVAFLRLLEGHRLLIEIPDLDLLLEPANSGPFTAQFTVNFFRAMADPPAPPATER